MNLSPCRLNDISKMEAMDDHYYSARKDALIHYSPYSFLKEIDAQKQWQEFVVDPLKNILKNNPDHSIAIKIKNHFHLFVIEKLSWDSSFFEGNMFRLHTVLFDHQDREILTAAVAEFKKTFFDSEKRHVYVKIPAEDILVAQAIGANGFYLTETRLNFYKELAGYQHERFDVRKAREDEADFVQKISVDNKNPYDRFHADPYFTEAQADRFLGEYAYQCVKGYSDAVLLPSVEGLEPAAFVAISNLSKDAAIVREELSRIVLTAVDPVCRGWHLKLCSEALYYAKERSSRWMFMTTQATNKAVFKTCHKLAFCLGSTEHVFSFNN